MPRAFLVKKPVVATAKRNWSELPDEQRAEIYVPSTGGRGFGGLRGLGSLGKWDLRGFRDLGGSWDTQEFGGLRCPWGFRGAEVWGCHRDLGVPGVWRDTEIWGEASGFWGNTRFGGAAGFGGFQMVWRDPGVRED